jgi:hypothetical protein
MPFVRRAGRPSNLKRRRPSSRRPRRYQCAQRRPKAPRPFARRHRRNFLVFFAPSQKSRKIPRSHLLTGASTLICFHVGTRPVARGGALRFPFSFCAKDRHPPAHRSLGVGGEGPRCAVLRGSGRLRLEPGAGRRAPITSAVLIGKHPANNPSYLRHPKCCQCWPR